MHNHPQRSPLEQAILAALAYHDVFEYPLTVEELWKWLFVEYAWDRDEIAQATPADVERALSSPTLAPLIERAGSFVSLKNRSSIVATRMARKVANERKWRRARRVASLLRIVPFVQFIGVVNSLAQHNARPESDIDLFIVVKRRRLWITRAVVTALVQLFGVRRHGSAVSDRICLSFYVSDRALSLEKLAHPALKYDSYLTYWITKVVPMFERGRCWESFQYANRWITECLPNGLSGMPLPYHDDSFIVKLIRFIPEVIGLSMIGDIAEWIARDLQYDHILAHKDSRVHINSTDVVVNDDVLKFHEQDRRQQYHALFQQRLQTVDVEAGD